MIAEERLKELVEQEATVYSCVDGFVNIFPLEKDTYFGGGFIQDWDYMMDINNLYEYEHDAIHASKYVNMIREEELSLPFWSDLSSIDKPADNLIVEFGGYRLIKFNFTKQKSHIVITRNLFDIFNKPLTQENYAEACEIIKKIWENGDAV